MHYTIYYVLWVQLSGKQPILYINLKGSFSNINIRNIMVERFGYEKIFKKKIYLAFLTLLLILHKWVGI